MPKAVHDADISKGAVETDNPKQSSQNSMAGQLPHRDNNPVKPFDSDFPEPGENPEHSGERRE